jgi:hypothetical protein
MVDINRAPQLRALVDELAPCVTDLILQPSVSRFAIGRTSNLRRRAGRQRCDGIVSLHGADDHALIVGIEQALAGRFSDHPKRVGETFRGTDTECESRYVYVAVWYDRS